MADFRSNHFVIAQTEDGWILQSRVVKDVQGDRRRQELPGQAAASDLACGSSRAFGARLGTGGKTLLKALGPFLPGLPQPDFKPAACRQRGGRAHLPTWPLRHKTRALSPRHASVSAPKVTMSPAARLNAEL